MRAAALPVGRSPLAKAHRIVNAATASPRALYLGLSISSSAPVPNGFFTSHWSSTRVQTHIYEEKKFGGRQLTATIRGHSVHKNVLLGAYSAFELPF